MTSVISKILAHAQSLPEGETLSARELLHLGSRAAIDQALSRLTRKGKLFRIGAGLYVHPVYTRFGTIPPNFDLVLKNIAKKTGEVLAPTGGVSANRLGLTTQNPKKTILLTSGRNRKFRFKKFVVELRRAPEWQLLEPNSLPGHVIRALNFMGRHQAEWVIEKVNNLINSEERKLLLALRPSVPQWIAMEVSRLAE